MDDPKSALQLYVDAFNDDCEITDAAVESAWQQVRADTIASATVGTTAPAAARTSARVLAVLTGGAVLAALALPFLLSRERPPAQAVASVQHRLPRTVASEPPVPPEAPMLPATIQPQAPKAQAPKNTTDSVPRADEAPGSPPPRRPRRKTKTRPTPTPPDPLDHASADPRDDLIEELRIIRRARAELRSNRGEATLRALAEHAQRFPHGALTQERWATEIQALCKLDRDRQASRAAQRYSATYTRDQNARRLLSECSDPPRTRHEP
ncbi:MAG: hypothetical protein ACRBN8_02110 [Nannocystales bacterium]